MIGKSVGLLVVLYNLEIVVGDEFIVAFGREVERGRCHAQTGEEEGDPGCSAERPRGIEVVTRNREAVVVVEDVGLGVLVFLSMFTAVVAESAGRSG